MKLVLSPDILLIFCLLVLKCQAYITREILIHEPVTFPCTCLGNQAKVRWTLFSPTKATIAKCDGQTCQIEQDYQKRFAIIGDARNGNFSMRISPVVYNDAGSYSCTCNGVEDPGVKLKVYVPIVIKAFEGKDAILPCYGHTRLDADDVQWKKEDKKVLEYHRASPNGASKDRFRIPKEAFQDGDLSLHIASVRESDAGFYLCLIHEESRDGDPRAVQLKVEKQPEHQPPTTPTCTTATIVGLAVTLGLLFLGIIGLIIYCVRKNKESQNTTSTNLRAPVQEEFQMLPKPSSTLPIQD